MSELATLCLARCEDAEQGGGDKAGRSERHDHSE